MYKQCSAALFYDMCACKTTKKRYFEKNMRMFYGKTENLKHEDLLQGEKY